MELFEGKFADSFHLNQVTIFESWNYFPYFFQCLLWTVVIHQVELRLFQNQKN